MTSKIKIFGQKRFFANESVYFRAQNNAQTASKQLQTNYQKPQKTACLTLKMVKMTLSEGQNLTSNFDFRGHISTFRAEKTFESVAFKAKNNA